jgi:4-amino-4-deoxychorismate lyase
MPFESTLRDRLGAGDGLIETFAFLPDDEAVRLERHLARLARSAAAFAIPFDPGEAQALVEAHATGTSPLRLRLFLHHGGTLELSKAPFTPLTADAQWQLRIARTRLDSMDPLLPHKTSRRTAYDLARAEYTMPEADEVIMLNERGEVCEGTITSVFMRQPDGILATPPLACGLLAGVLREELVESGRAVETVLTPNQLRAANEIFVGNSLRGLIRAHI